MSAVGFPWGADAAQGGGAVPDRAALAPRLRLQRRPVHGLLLLDKALGQSSNQALQRAKWLLRAEKAGHTGTLDPLASGLLPLCFGAATKFSQLQLDADKVYAATLRLGLRTSSGDAEGEVLERRPVACTPAQVQQVLARFLGPIQQLPPMHSALKHQGRALYEYARAGLEVERAPRRVTIHALELLALDLGGPEPTLGLRVRCSKGTYIRTLGEDIGAALDCGAHLAALRRERSGGLGLERSLSLEQLEALPEHARLQALLPLEALLAGHERVMLDDDNAARFLTGLRRRGPWPDAERVAVYAAPGAQPSHPIALLGSAHIQGGELIPARLLSPIEIQQIRLQNQP